MVVPIIIQGNVSKSKPSTNIAENVSKNVAENSNPITKVPAENLIKTLDSLHAYGQHPKEDKIGKIIG